VGNWKTIVCACIVIAAVVVICIAPAYSLQPTALRAWNSSLGLLAALSTLVIFSLAAPSNCERFILEAVRSRPGGCALLQFTCTLLI